MINYARFEPRYVLIWITPFHILSKWSDSNAVCSDTERWLCTIPPLATFKYHVIPWVYHKYEFSFAPLNHRKVLKEAKYSEVKSKKWSEKSSNMKCSEVK